MLWVWEGHTYTWQFFVTLLGVVRGDLQKVVFCCSRVFPDFPGTPTKHLFNLSILGKQQMIEICVFFSWAIRILYDILYVYSIYIYIYMGIA